MTTTTTTTTTTTLAPTLPAAADPDAYEPVIGLECHVQLRTASKAFTAAGTEFGAPPNTAIDPYTLGLPGSLPVLNRRVVELALRMGLACGCTIRLRSEFARKNYFYPDLPKGYQISQHEAPLCEGGAVEFLWHGALRQVPLVRIHVEEDAGKTLHGAPGGTSRLDYNRAGVALIEVVSQPALRSAEEAGEYLRAIRQLVRFLGISDGNMEEGSLRCDANVSLRRPGSAQLGTRTELKNINSFRNVQRAIEHEIGRQAALLRAGQAVVQETRGWDAEAGLSRPQRSKEEAQDYRYFPEPDLPPLVIDPAWLDQIRAGLPLLPLQRRARYQESLGLPPSDAAALTAEPELCEYFDAMLAAFGVVLDGGAPNERQRGLAKLASNWLLSELLGALHRDGRGIAESPVGAAALAELVRHVADQVVSGRQAKEVFARMYATGSAAAAIIEALGLRLISDTTALEAACRQVVEARENHKQVQGYARNPRLLGYFVGKVMAATGGQAHPERLSDILRRLLADKAPPE